ncbi:MAG TPA: HipA N-terminal domain-containing protein [bacterium]|nr:HipA N-terminal domain-containing protein [bacterium]
MRRLEIFMQGISAGYLDEMVRGKSYKFTYHAEYSGLPVSLSMPVKTGFFEFDCFPPFFDGLLPEGILLDALLSIRKIDREDMMSQLAAVGEDVVGATTAREIPT